MPRPDVFPTYSSDTKNRGWLLRARGWTKVDCAARRADLRPSGPRFVIRFNPLHPMVWPKLSTTRHGDTAETNFEVIHPHHPLRGQKFKLITYRHNWGEDRVYFHDATGRLRSIPAGWTTAVDADPFATVAAGRC